MMMPFNQHRPATNAGGSSKSRMDSANDGFTQFVLFLTSKGMKKPVFLFSQPCVLIKNCIEVWVFKPQKWNLTKDN
jgi:hypothetical protein